MATQPKWGDILDTANSALRVNVAAGTLTTGDIELGAVELKNGTDDTRATVTAGNALKVDLVSTTANSTAVKVDNSAVNQPTIPTPAGTAAQAPTNNASAAYVASLAVKATPGTLYGVTGYNSGSAQFLQLHDATSLPSNTAVPKVVITVPATSNFSIDFGVYGKRFATGIVVANSSTGPTLTTGSADCWIEARYV